MLIGHVKFLFMPFTPYLANPVIVICFVLRAKFAGLHQVVPDEILAHLNTYSVPNSANM